MGLFRVLNKEISFEDFEEWTYIYCDKLEKEFSLDDYLEIMCFDYKKKGRYYTLAKLLFKSVSMMEFENYRLKKLYIRALEDDEILEAALIEGYYLCEEYPQIFSGIAYYGMSLLWQENIGEESWCDARTNKEFIQKYRNKIYEEVIRINEILKEKTLKMKMPNLNY